MAKLLFFAVVAMALVALSTAELDNPVQQHCQLQVQRIPLEVCRQVVDHQLAVQLPFFHPRSSLLRSSEWRTDERGQCCQQLRHVSPECRVAAIRQIVRHYEQQAVAPLGEGSYYPSETYPQQEQGKEQQQQEQEWYLPSQTSPQQWQHQGPYGSSQTYRPQHQEQGPYHPSQTYPQQQQQGVGVCGQQQQQGRQESVGSPHLRIIISHQGRQPAAQHELGETAQQQWGQGPYFGAEHEQQVARLRQLRVVAKARQVAAQLPAMCQLQGRSFSAGQY